MNVIDCSVNGAIFLSGDVFELEVKMSILNDKVGEIIERTSETISKDNTLSTYEQISGMEICDSLLFLCNLDTRLGPARSDAVANTIKKFSKIENPQTRSIAIVQLATYINTCK